MPSVRSFVAQWEASAADAQRRLDAMGTAGDYDVEEAGFLRGTRDAYVSAAGDMIEWLDRNTRAKPKPPPAA